MLDNDNRVALVAKLLKRAEKLRVVSRVEADRRLVEHVEHAREARADLGGQPDPLALTAGERGGLAVKREVAEAHLVEECQPAADLLEQFGRDHTLRWIEDKLGEKLPRLGDWQAADRVEREFAGPLLPLLPLARGVGRGEGVLVRGCRPAPPPPAGFRLRFSSSAGFRSAGFGFHRLGPAGRAGPDPHAPCLR